MKKSDMSCCNYDCNQGRFCLQRLRTLPPDDYEPHTWNAMMGRLLDVLACVGLIGLAVAVYQLCLHLGF